MDEIRIQGVRAAGHHGVSDEERAVSQEFVVDATLGLETWKAAASDELEDTVDYDALTQELAAEVRGTSVKLIETLATRMLDRCFADPRVKTATVSVHKPDAPLSERVGDVSVKLERQRVEVILGLGSNIGDRMQYLQNAVDQVAATPGMKVAAVSPVIETAPVGGPDQDDFLNAVIKVNTWRPVSYVLAACQRIESANGRQREERWGPRTLDIDVITYGSLVQRDSTLTIPHPRAATRAFVLAPWLAIDPDAVLPTGAMMHHFPVTELLKQAPDRQGVRHYSQASLVLPT